MRADRAAFLVRRDKMHAISELGADMGDVLWTIVPGFSKWPVSRQKAFADDVSELMEDPGWHPYESVACYHDDHEACGRMTDGHGDVWRMAPACPVCHTPCACECHE